VWQSCLGVAVDDPDSDFFALGGSSLDAMTMCHRLQESLGLPAPALADFFREPTLGFVTRWIEEQGPALQEVAL
jgi:acyl carrier protein